MICRNCKKKKFKKIFKLGSQPISSVFLKKKKKIKNFSLDLYICKNCKLVQLDKIPNLKDMYGKDYGYKTSISNLMINHLEKKFNNFKKRKLFEKNKNILDIGSNDGTFLNFFAKEKKSYKLFGIDPSASAFKNNYNKKIKVINKFFEDKTVNNFLKKGKLKFSLITSFAMFYDVEDPNKFCQNIYKILDKDGIWSLEFSYFPLLLENLTYDQICHEHCAYYTLSSFRNIVEKNKLKVIDFFINEINGGSIEVICAKQESKLNIKKLKIKKLINSEKKINSKSFKKFQSRVKKNKINLVNFIKKNKKNNIIGYGASTKGNVILNYCGINNKVLRYVCDANPIKHNKFTPGSLIKIISKKEMRLIKPKFLLVFIWSFRREVIIQEEEFLKNGGSLVFPLPKLHTINKYNYKYYKNKLFGKKIN